MMHGHKMMAKCMVCDLAIEWHMITGDLPPSSSVTSAPTNPAPLAAKWRQRNGQVAPWHGDVQKQILCFFHWNNMVNCKSAKFRGVTHYDHGYEPPRINCQWSKYKAFIPIVLLLASRTGVKLGAAASRINLPTRPEPVSTVGLFGMEDNSPAFVGNLMEGNMKGKMMIHGHERHKKENGSLRTCIYMHVCFQMNTLCRYFIRSNRFIFIQYIPDNLLYS